MAFAVGRFMLFAWCCQRSFSQAPLEHAGKDCYMSCWREPGFCEYCGSGNACCRKGVEDGPKECSGNLDFKAPMDTTGKKGQYHECVKALFLPGQAPPASSTAVGQVGKLNEAQCISYMAKKGCGWTEKFSCPGQTEGFNGKAHVDNSMGFQCCCTNNLWKESATTGDAAVPNAANNIQDKLECANYMKTNTCDWTGKWSCPGQMPLGEHGVASVDSSISYKCCCQNSMWKVGTTTTYNPYAASTFDIDAGMSKPTGPTLIPSSQNNGFAVNVAAGEKHGYGIADPTIAPEENDPYLLNNHDGSNVHIEKVHLTDASFTPTEHHGPIHNKFSNNNAMAKKERCTFGICADLDTNDPEMAGMPDTAHGIAITTGMPGSSATVLPSYRVTLGGDKQQNVQIEKIAGGVATTVDADSKPTVAPNNGEVHTLLTSPAAAGDVALLVQDGTGFAIGDEISLNNGERKRIVNLVAIAQTGPATGRRLQPDEMTLDSPLANTYPAGADVKKLPAIKAKAAVVTAKKEEGSLSGSSDSLDSSSGSIAANKRTAIGIGAAICGVVAIALFAGSFFLQKKKKKGKAGTDREAYLKNDFIERQPIYHDVPQSTEMEPMMQGQDPNGEEPQAPAEQMQPTSSFPLQVGAPVSASTSYPQAMAPSIVSFPGMPTIGQSMLQTTAPAASMYQARPQASSTIVTGATPTYTASPSTYVSAPSAYSQVMPSQNLGVTTALPQTSSMFQQNLGVTTALPQASSMFQQPAANSMYQYRS